MSGFIKSHRGRSIGTRILALIAVLTSCLAYPAASQKSQWELVREQNGIKIHARKIAHSRIKEFRASTDIKTSLSALVAVLDDVSSNSMAYMLLKKISLTERVTYRQTKPPLVRDRDVVVYVIINQDPNTRIVTIQLEGAPDFIPEQPGFVRIKELRGHWQFIPLKNGMIRVIYQLYVAPGGRLNNLGFFVNLSLRDRIYRTLLNIRERVKRPRYQQVKYKSLKEAEL